MAFWGKFWTRALLYCLGFWSIKWVYVNKDGSTSSRPPPGQQAFGCYVSNHCSWIDIILYMSQIFPSFVAKKEVSGLPLIGPISKAMQCLFVDREARLASFSEGPAAGQRLQGDGGQGMSRLVRERMVRRHGGQSAELPLLLFPEGTTTNNTCLIPFKRGAFLAGVPVQPIVLRYDRGGRFSPTWDAMPGHLHILLALTELSFAVTAYVLPLYAPSAAEKADPALFAENVRQAMVAFSGLPAVEETFADKLELFRYINQRLREQRRGKGKGKGREEGEASAERQGKRREQGGSGKARQDGEAVARVEVQARAEGPGLRHRKEIGS